MVGYNIEEINNLIDSIKQGYKNLGESIAQGWPGVSETLASEWAGPDSESFERELADRVCSLYVGCQSILQQLVDNLRKIGEGWKEFQAQNMLSGASAVSNYLDAFDIKYVRISDDSYNITTYVKAATRQYTSSTKYGIVNGIQSATNINSKVKSYVSDIHDKVNSLYGGITSAAAFFGNGQTEAIDEYISSIGQSIAKLNTCVGDMQTSLTQLINAYIEQANAFNTTLGGVDTSFTDERAVSMN